jgi:hypothetical protein
MVAKRISPIVDGWRIGHLQPLHHWPRLARFRLAEPANVMADAGEWQWRTPR